MAKRVTLVVGLGFALVGCGGGGQSSSPPASPASGESGEDNAVLMGGEAADIPESETGETSPTLAPEEGPMFGDEGAERSAIPADEEVEPLQVRYHVSPEGLRVTVSGVEFVPEAEPVRVNGGWGVKLSVKARARDEVPHVLYTPEQGPLAFYAVVDRGSQVEKKGDERTGEGETRITSDPTRFSRTWPNDMDMAPLAEGQKLELQVGLWGVGESVTKHRPLRRFIVVKMVGGKKPQAVVSAPDTAQ